MFRIWYLAFGLHLGVVCVLCCVECGFWTVRVYDIHGCCWYLFFSWCRRGVGCGHWGVMGFGMVSGVGIVFSGFREGVGLRDVVRWV